MHHPKALTHLPHTGMDHKVVGTRLRRYRLVYVHHQEQPLDPPGEFYRIQESAAVEMSSSLLSSAVYLIDLHPLNRNRSKHRHSISKWWQVQSAQYLRKYLCVKSERSGKNILPKRTASTQPRTNLPFQAAPARSALLHPAALRSCSPNLLPHPNHPQRLCSFIYGCSLRANLAPSELNRRYS